MSDPLNNLGSIGYHTFRFHLLLKPVYWLELFYSKTALESFLVLMISFTTL